MKNFLLIILSIITLNGCGGVSTEKIEHCIPECSIFSTNELIFYLIYDKSKYKSYSDLDIPENDAYLCIHYRQHGNMNECTGYTYLGIMYEKLPENYQVLFTGTAIKTKKWGVVTINTGPSPSIYFHAKDNSNRNVWVSGDSLLYFFKNMKDINSSNLETYNVLKIKQKLLSVESDIFYGYNQVLECTVK